jgi:hypothetical protein
VCNRLDGSGHFPRVLVYLSREIAMQSSTSHSSLRPFGWCVVLLFISTQSEGQEIGRISGNCVNG